MRDMETHQKEARGLVCELDHGEYHGGVFILVEGLSVAYVCPAKRPNQEDINKRVDSIEESFRKIQQIKLKFSGPKEIGFYRESAVAKGFPDIYKSLLRNEPVTAEMLEALSVLRGTRQ